ncbi:MAG: hypothetical protein IJV33_00265 [Bacteroidaceae bacterium]|nr:hypothetical protein [Bacteroidaceae bacterium]
MKKFVLTFVGILLITGVLFLIGTKMVPFMAWLFNTEMFGFVGVPMALILLCVIIDFSLMLAPWMKKHKKIAIPILFLLSPPLIIPLFIKKNVPQKILIQCLIWILLPLAICNIAMVFYCDRVYHGLRHFNRYDRIETTGREYSYTQRYVGLADKWGNEIIPPHYVKIIDCGDYAKLYRYSNSDEYTVFYFDERLRPVVGQENSNDGGSVSQKEDEELHSAYEELPSKEEEDVYDDEPMYEEYEDPEPMHVESPHTVYEEVPCIECGGTGFTSKKLYMGNGHVIEPQSRCVWCHGKGTVREAKTEWY